MQKISSHIKKTWHRINIALNKIIMALEKKKKYDTEQTHGAQKNTAQQQHDTEKHGTKENSLHRKKKHEHGTDNTWHITNKSFHIQI